MSGTVANGSAIANASIVVTDSTGATVGSAVSASDGTFQVQPLSTALAPLVLIATARSGKQLASVVPTTAIPVVNITPLSDLVASLLSSNGSPETLAQDVVATPSAASVTAVANEISAVRTILSPLTTALSIPQADWMNQPFTADGTGVDQLLDSLDVKIRPTGSVANIQITLRGILDDGVDPAFMSFTNATVPSAVGYSVDASKLIPSGTSKLFANFLGNLTNCYATVPRTSGTMITASACTSLFYNNDPTSYLNSSRTVGINGAWPGIFESSLTGEQFSEGRYLFSHMVTLHGGGMVLGHVFGYFIRTATGNIARDEVTLTLQNGALVLVGDQHVYQVSVEAYNQVRQFVNQPTANYVESGTTINVNHVINPNGTLTGTVDHAIATSALGTFTLATSPGFSFLDITVGGTHTAETAPRLAGQFLSPATAAQKGLPSAYVSELWMAPALSDAQIAQVNELMSWQVQIFLPGNTTVVPDAVEYVRSFTRPATMAEMVVLAPTMATLTSPNLATLTASAGPNAYFTSPAASTFPMSWVTPQNGTPVSELALYGTGGGVSFNDTASIASTATQGTITCSAEPLASDPHCSTGYTGDQLNGATLEMFDRENTEIRNSNVVDTIF